MFFERLEPEYLKCKGIMMLIRADRSRERRREREKETVRQRENQRQTHRSENY